MNSKYIFDSNTIQGLIKVTVAFCVAVLNIFGFNILPGEEGQIVELFSGMVVSTFGLYGIIQAVKGRMVADKPLSAYK